MTRALLMPSLLLVAACSSPQRDGAMVASTTIVHTRPSDRAMTRAFERVAGDATPCFAPGEHGARVEGAFDGATGAFRVARVEATQGALSFAASQCVRAAAGRAHVRAFRDAQTAFSYAFEATVSVVDGGVAPVTRTVRFDDSQGTATPAGDVVLRDAPVYRACYEREALTREPTAAGTVELHLALDARGAVVRASSRTTSTFPDPTLMELVARCIEAHVGTLTFAPPRDASGEVVVPLAFTPGELARDD